MSFSAKLQESEAFPYFFGRRGTTCSIVRGKGGTFATLFPERGEAASDKWPLPA